MIFPHFIAPPSRSHPSRFLSFAPETRSPEASFAEGYADLISDADFEKLLLPEVQKGSTVLPERS